MTLMIPPVAVLLRAPAKLLQGAVILHGVASSPVPDTQVRRDCAYTGVCSSRNMNPIAPNSFRMMPSLLSCGARLGQRSHAFKLLATASRLPGLRQEFLEIAGSILQGLVEHAADRPGFAVAGAADIVDFPLAGFAHEIVADGVVDGLGARRTPADDGGRDEI